MRRRAARRRPTATAELTLPCVTGVAKHFQIAPRPADLDSERILDVLAVWPRRPASMSKKKKKKRENKKQRERKKKNQRDKKKERRKKKKKIKSSGESASASSALHRRRLEVEFHRLRFRVCRRRILSSTELRLPIHLRRSPRGLIFDVWHPWRSLPTAQRFCGAKLWLRGEIQIDQGSKPHDGSNHRRDMRRADLLTAR